MPEQEQSKVDQIWQTVAELAEDEETSGVLNFQDDAGSGYLVAQLDGKLWQVSIDPYPGE